MIFCSYLLVFLSLLFTPLANAEVMGGDTYLIKEQDFLAFIQQRLTTMKTSGQLEQVQQQLQKRSEAQAQRPAPIAKITRTTTNRTWIFDPSITLPYDLKDANGNVFAQKGTRFNPLEKVSLNKALLFFDSDDAEQVKWAQQTDKNLQAKTKLILVKGSIIETVKQFQKPIYFDQQGRLTSRFSIRHTPAIVTQEGLRLRIQEVKP